MPLHTVQNLLNKTFLIISTQLFYQCERLDKKLSTQPPPAIPSLRDAGRPNVTPPPWGRKRLFKQR